VALVTTDVSEGQVAFISSMERISELGTKLAVTNIIYSSEKLENALEVSDVICESTLIESPV
jgi:hypothetical protein